MCECCNGDCKLCGGYGFIEFPEPITKIYLDETIGPDVFSLDSMIVNDKYRVINDECLNPPYRYEEIMPEEKEKIDKTFSEHISEISEKCSKDLDTYLQQGYNYCQRDSNPDESFRAMILIMQKWKEYMDLQKKDNFSACSGPGKIISVVDKQPSFIPIPDLPKTTSNHLEDRMISHLKDMGRIQEKIDVLLRDDIFDNLSKHNPYFDSEHELESDKLYDLRRKFACIEEILDEIRHILQDEDE